MERLKSESGRICMEKLIKEVPQCKHHKKKKLKPNEFWSPNPFEMYKQTDDSYSKEEKVKTTPTNFQEN
jgi:hypothetical protein